jgi:hypothetical protein
MTETPPGIATTRIIRNAARKVGGKAALLDILKQWSHAGESEDYLALREQLDNKIPLEEIFVQVREGGPYVEIYNVGSIDTPEIEVTYGHCYGGTCGSGMIHRFQKEKNTWTILPGDRDFIIH